MRSGTGSATVVSCNNIGNNRRAVYKCESSLLLFSYEVHAKEEESPSWELFVLAMDVLPFIIFLVSLLELVKLLDFSFNCCLRMAIR